MGNKSKTMKTAVGDLWVVAPREASFAKMATFAEGNGVAVEKNDDAFSLATKLVEAHIAPEDLDMRTDGEVIADSVTTETTEETVVAKPAAKKPMSRTLQRGKSGRPDPNVPLTADEKQRRKGAIEANGGFSELAQEMKEKSPKPSADESNKKPHAPGKRPWGTPLNESKLHSIVNFATARGVEVGENDNIFVVASALKRVGLLDENVSCDPKDYDDDVVAKSQQRSHKPRVQAVGVTDKHRRFQKSKEQGMFLDEVLSSGRSLINAIFKSVPDADFAYFVRNRSFDVYLTITYLEEHVPQDMLDIIRESVKKNRLTKKISNS